MAVVISVSFIMCWSPYSVVSLWSTVGPGGPIPPQLSLLPCMFAKSSTACNPVIYYIFSQSFKREVKKLVRCCGGKDGGAAKRGGGSKVATATTVV